MADLITEFGSAVVYSFTSAQPNPLVAKVLLTVLFLLLLVIGIYFICSSITTQSSTDPRVASTNIALATATRVNQLEGFATAATAAAPATKKESFGSQARIAELVFAEAAEAAEPFAGEIVLGQATAAPAPAPKTMTAKGSLYDDLINSLAAPEQYLVNLCPLTASIGGYIGPMINGVFNPEFYVRKALRAGIRSFVLPISTYHDDNKKPPNWPYSGKPAIVCRDINGKIASLNGMTILKFCQTLVQYMNENSNQDGEPILLYLDATAGYIPDPVKDEKAYVQMTSDIASELAPLDKNRLMLLGSYGSAVGAEHQGEILTQIPLTELKGKIIIFTNFDINVATKKAYASIKPVLYHYANFIYKPVTAANIGTTTVGQAQPGARSVKLGDISGSTVNWTDQARITWYITASDPLTLLPNAGQVEKATMTGIQAIPIPFFALDTAETDPIWTTWKGYAWRLKAEGARYSKPAPIVPSSPNTTLNARVDPSLQPGQLLVK